MKKKYTAVIAAISLAASPLCSQEIIDDSEAVLQKEEQESAKAEQIDKDEAYLNEGAEATAEKAQKVVSSENTKEAAKTGQTVPVEKSITPVVEATQKQKAVSNVAKEEAKTEKSTAEEELVEPNVNRIITVKQNQHFTIELNGNKWTYLGEESEDGIISYDGSTEKEKTTEFYVYAQKAGTTVLHFYKNDVIAKTYLDEYIQIDVTASDTSTAQSKEQATEAVSAKAEGSSKSENASAKADSALISQTQSNSQQAKEEKSDKTSYKEALDPTSFKIESKKESADTPSETDTILEKAKEAYEAGNYSEAKSLLDTFFSNAITNLDQGLFIQGQVLEAFSPIQNIRGSLSSYKNLLTNYPLSRYAKEAEKRAIYLERFYFDIY